MEIKEKISLLIVLQEKDVNLDALRSKAQEIPQKIAEEQALLETIKLDTEEKKKNLTKLQLLKKEKELELETKEVQIRKHSSELNSIKSNDTYRALLSEIDNCKREKNSLENQILDVMEGIEKESVLIKENEKYLKSKEAESAAKISALQSDLKKIEGDIVIFEAQRGEYVKQLPNELLNRYDYIRESRQGFAVVPVDGENCGGCHIVLRPQIINDVCKNTDIVTCDSCSRILFKK
jgi:uncharacterized protein